MMYTPTATKVNDVTHAVIGKSVCVKSHTLAYAVGNEAYEEIHVFNPRSDELGQLAAAQVKTWESFGLNYDIKKYNQGKSFETLAKKGDTIYNLFDPAHVLKLYYRRGLPRSRPQKQRDIESGVTCHSLIMDVYNVVWLDMSLKLASIDLFPATNQPEYVSVKYSNTTLSDKYANRPYYFPAVTHFGSPDWIIWLC